MELVLDLSLAVIGAMSGQDSRTQRLGRTSIVRNSVATDRMIVSDGWWFFVMIHGAAGVW